ncbi:MAG: hypothetical protein ACLUHA_12315 [Bacteroides stercoris]
MGRLRLKQNRMEFQEVMPGKRPSERILCGNSGDKPLRLIGTRHPEVRNFRTEPEVIQPGSEADIVVTVDASLIPARKEKDIHIPDYHRRSGCPAFGPDPEYKSKLYQVTIKKQETRYEEYFQTNGFSSLSVLPYILR